MSSKSNILADPGSRSLVLTTLFFEIGFQATYFSGFIGTASYSLHATAMQVTVLVALLGGLFVVGSAMSGVFIDWAGPRRTMACAMGGLMAVMVAAYVAPLDFFSLQVCAMLFGFGCGIGSTCFGAFPPFLVVGRDALKDLNGLNDSAVHVAIVVGPALAGVLSGRFGLRAVFLLSLVAFAVALVWCLSIRERYVPGEHEAEDGVEAAHDTSGSFLVDFREGLAFTFRDRTLRMILVVGFLGFFAYGAFDSLESLYYRDVLRVGVEWMGYLVMISGIGSVVGSLLLMRLPARMVTMRTYVLMLLVCGLGSMLYVGTDSLVWASVGQAVTGFGFGLMMPVQHMLTQENCDIGYLGRVTSVIRVALNLAGVVPMFFAPALSDRFGVQAVLFGASCFVAAMGALFCIAAWRRSSAGEA